MYFEKHKN